MDKGNICIKKIDSLDELESQVDKEQLIYCDNMQNTFIIINFDDVQKIGIAYYDYGVVPDYLCSGDGAIFYFSGEIL